MKLTHPYDLLRSSTMLSDTAHHALQLSRSVFHLLVWMLYAIVWSLAYLWEFFTDPLLKVNIIKGALELLHRLPPSVDVEHNAATAPIYAYLQRALNDTTHDVLGDEEDEAPTEERTPYDTNPEDIVDLDELTYPADEDTSTTDLPSGESGKYAPESNHERAASLFTEDALADLEARALEEPNK